MTKKQKYILVFYTIILLFSLNTNFVSALEVKPESYPNIPFAPVLTENSQLPEFVAYFFALGIYLAGILAVISLVIGGIQLIFSSVSPEARSNAIDRIKSAILGLVLTLSSVIILSTINPVFINPTLTPLDALAGVFYINGTDEQQATSNPDTSSIIAAGFKEIIYKCPGSGTGQGPVLLVWKFPEKNFGRVNEEVVIERKKCGEKTSIEVPSFKISFESPGVYYFTKTGCTGFMSQVHLSNIQEVEEPFKSEMQSVQIINDTKNNSDPKDDIEYGIVLHKEINFRGDCSVPLDAHQLERDCFDIPSEISSPMSSANIFTINKNTPETSGNGVVFYSRPFGYKTGYFKLSPQNIGISWQNGPSVIDFTNSYNNVDIKPEEKALCKNFEICPGSMLIDGHYLVTLYAKQVQSQEPYCHVFNGGENEGKVPNLNDFGIGIIGVQGRKLNWVNIIPIK